jgi:peptidoglycan/LPS O-acetylase OafA/YrhL
MAKALNFNSKPLSQESSVFLNIVRVTACELVVLCHFLTRYQPVPWDALFRLGSTMGGVAVLLFFVLSGLLVSYSLFNKLGNSEYRFRHFFVDRFSRIYSGLVPALLFAAVLAVMMYVTNYGYFMELCTMQSMPSPLNFAMTLGMLEQRFPSDFFNSLLSPIGFSPAIPDVTAFGFNGILWTLVVEWWIYMIFGWVVIGSLALAGKRKRGNGYKATFLVVAALLSLPLVGMFEQSSSLIIVWFVGVVMMLAISSKKVRTKLSNPLVIRALGVLFGLSLISAFLAAYVAFAWTNQFYDLSLGVALSMSVFLGVLLFNAGGFKKTLNLLASSRIAKWSATGASFSYTLFLTHYPIIIFLAGLHLPFNRFLMLIPILLITNVTAFCLARFTEQKHKAVARTIKRWLNISEC